MRLKLWTVWADYFATGEGRSLMACIVYAQDRASAQKKFAALFGECFEKFSQARQGVVYNDVTSYLFSKSALDDLQALANAGNIVAHASIHINRS